MQNRRRIGGAAMLLVVALAGSVLADGPLREPSRGWLVGGEWLRLWFPAFEFVLGAEGLPSSSGDAPARSLEPPAVTSAPAPPGSGGEWGMGIDPNG